MILFSSEAIREIEFDANEGADIIITSFTKDVESWHNLQ